MPLHQITIMGTEAVVGSGFIDPKTTKNYIEAKTYSSTLTEFTLNAGDVFMVGDVVYELTGTPDAGTVINAINNDTNIHHVEANSVGEGSALVLQAAIGWTHIKPSITEVTPGVLERMGMLAPIVDTVEMPTDLADNELKLKGNIRWEILKEKLSKNVNVTLESVNSSNGLIDVVPSSVGFKVNTPVNYYYYDDEGEIYHGQTAVVKAMVDALMSSTVRRRAVYDPSYAGETIPSDSQGKVIGPVVRDITIVPAFATEGDATDAILL